MSSRPASTSTFGLFWPFFLPFSIFFFHFQDHPFDDGHSPPQEIIDTWLDLVNHTFHGESKSSDDDSTIAVHCVAGLGRAPVLVAIALIEEGMDAVEAVTMIRTHRRGAINAKQLNYLQTYTPTKTASTPCGCQVS